MKFALLCRCLVFLFFAWTACAGNYKEIIIPADCHPAIKSAAQILAHDLALSNSAIHAEPQPGAPLTGEIVLQAAPATATQTAFLGTAREKIKRDGYAIVFKDGGALIYGAQPRSLLYAAGDVALWTNRTTGTWVRNPDFAIRSATFRGHESVAQYVAKMGVNIIIGGTSEAARGLVTFKDTLPKVYAQMSPDAQRRLDWRSAAAERRAAAFAQQCHDADVKYYSFLYGNNFQLWSPELYRAVLKVFPSARGVSESNSWEKGTLCPSDPATWKVFDAFVKEFVEKTHADGLYTTFWDHYGLYCQDPRCQNDGLNRFSNELYVCVKNYHDTLAPLGKKLIVRTWASGVAHWLRGQFVHAPGYGGFTGEGTNVWGRVIHELPADIILQTKVYNSDCQPAPPFSPLLGHAQPHTEIAEYQITGQTRGRLYFPASSVNYTDWTMKKSLALIGHNGGVSVFPGVTKQSNYSVFNDILNSINLYAWRQLSWDVNTRVNKIWLDWATPIYGPKAAPHIIIALRLSESVVNHLFSTLGMGNDTNSGFPGTVARRETLLKYTNRYFLPAYAKFLEPTKENIQRVIDEKSKCFRQIDEMFHQLDLAKPYLSLAQADELTTRFNWLKQFAIVNANLEESLWRYRYLRYEATMFTTDPKQMKYLAQSYDAVQAHRKLLFQFKPDQKFSCYNVSLGDLWRKPSLGNPMPLMHELYQDSKECVESVVGPDFLPKAWLR